MTSIVGGPSKAELVFNLGFFDLEGRMPIQFTLGDGRKLEGFISALKQLRNKEGKVVTKYMLQGFLGKIVILGAMITLIAPAGLKRAKFLFKSSKKLCYHPHQRCGFFFYRGVFF
ncbi:MAG: hypothetical protein K5837_00285 [Candidatus Saccharibacteria bacterium]|nr:hypothetical protein [Candidatus Saccharibacteria bacterium]